MRKIKERLEQKFGKKHKITVGSTEQFQGQEREAMIVTTARSSVTCLEEGTGKYTTATLIMTWMSESIF